MFTGFSGSNSAQPSSQQQQLESNGASQQPISAAASSSTSAAGVTTTPATSVGQGTPGQACSAPTTPVGVALGVASAGGLLPSPAYGW